MTPLLYDLHNRMVTGLEIPIWNHPISQFVVHLSILFFIYHQEIDICIYSSICLYNTFNSKWKLKGSIYFVSLYEKNCNFSLWINLQLRKNVVFFSELNDFTTHNFNGKIWKKAFFMHWFMSHARVFVTISAIWIIWNYLCVCDTMHDHARSHNLNYKHSIFWVICA